MSQLTTTAMLSPEQYRRRATPPPRFQAAFTDVFPPQCLKSGCGWPMRLDLVELAQVRYAIASWPRRLDRCDPEHRPPLRLLHLSMRCLNGHLETWHADPEPLLPPSPLPKPSARIERDSDEPVRRSNRPSRGSRRLIKLSPAEAAIEKELWSQAGWPRPRRTPIPPAPVAR